MPTALELKPEELKSYVEKAPRKLLKPSLSPEQLAERTALLHRVRQAATMLKSRFGVRRVILFGSLAHEAWFTWDSDVDLAVEGLKGKEYWDAWRIVEEFLGDRMVDLIDMEMASDSLKRAIKRYGIEL